MQLLAFGILKWIHSTKSSVCLITPEAYMPSSDLKDAYYAFPLPRSTGNSSSRTSFSDVVTSAQTFGQDSAQAAAGLPIRQQPAQHGKRAQVDCISFIWEHYQERGVSEHVIKVLIDSFLPRSNIASIFKNGLHFVVKGRFLHIPRI